MKPVPMPWILCGPGVPPERTFDSVGSTATTFTSGFCSLRYLPAPEMVPPVPMPETRMSTCSHALPSQLEAQSVERRWLHGSKAAVYRSAGEVWPPLNIGKLSRLSNNLNISGAVHGQKSGQSSRVVCRTLAVLGYVLGRMLHELTCAHQRGWQRTLPCVVAQISGPVVA